jgi:hypothetical protein
MADNFLRCDCDQPFLLRPTSATGCRQSTWPGSSWTSSTNSTLPRSWPRTGPTGTGPASATSRPWPASWSSPLKLCAVAGMVRSAWSPLDGTKLVGSAADKANRTLDRLEREVAEILLEAAKADQREDRLFGQARGDELPEALASKASRLARLRQAKALLEAEAAERARRFA